MYKAIILSTLALAYAAPNQQSAQAVAQQREFQQEMGMSGVQGAVTNHQQVIDTLNHQLQADGGVHANAERLAAYITGADSQIDNAIATVSNALAPLTFGMSKAVANFLLGPFVQSVTNGAEVFIANVIGGGEDRLNAELIGRMTGNYSRLVALSSKHGVDASRLQSLNQQLTQTLPKIKRDISRQEAAERQFQQQAGMSGVQGAVTNHQQVIDTLNHQLRQAGGDPHAHADAMVAYITGADSQIDNAIATVSNALAPFTFGASKAIGDFLLGPFVQSVTNGAEVFLANMVGGAQDRMDAALIGRLTGNYSRLVALSSKHGVDASKLQSLNQQITNSLPKAKRDLTRQQISERQFQQQQAMSGVEGAVTNHRQVVDTLNRQLHQAGGDPHAHADAMVAYITGADSQIDNAIATVSNALAPFTFGMSKAIGDYLLGPFVQSVTNGAEVFLANLIGGAQDRMDAEMIGRLTGNYSRLVALSSKHGVDASKLQSLNQQIANTLPK